MNEYFIDAIGARFGRAFLPDGYVAGNDNDEDPRMAVFSSLLEAADIPHEIGRQLLLKVWEAVIIHTQTAGAYRADEMARDLEATATSLFGKPLPTAVTIALAVALDAITEEWG